MNDELPRRKSMRLANYDYRTPGCYFVTICTAQRRHLFIDPLLYQIATTHWNAIPDHFPHVNLDTWILMPNHLHGLLWLKADLPLKTESSSRGHICAGSLSAIVRAYKAATTRTARQMQDSQRLWQPNYYDRVVRDERELYAVRQYIETNPERWNQEYENLDELLDRMQKH